MSWEEVTVAGAKFASPEYVTVIACGPAGQLAFDNVPWPDEFAMPLVNVVPPSAKLKAPEPVPPKGPVNVAVRVSAAPTSAGLADEATSIMPGAWVTV